MTFEEAARRFIAMHSDTWRNDKHRAQWTSSLEAYAFPTLGDRPVAAVEGAQITEALAPIWTVKGETARRVKQRIERVCQGSRTARLYRTRRGVSSTSSGNGRR